MKYNAFIDCVGRLAFQISFLEKAVAKSEELHRFFLRDIFIEPSEHEEGRLRGVSCDGRRIHLVDPIDKSATVFGLTQGYWQVFKSTQKPIVWAARLSDEETIGRAFPDYRKVIPTGTPKYRTIFTGFCLRYAIKRNFGELAKFLHDFPDATAINLEYLHDLGMNTDWDVDWYDANRALKFTAQELMAVIQPIMID
jgi:hypothetical protein